jgi:hypothetical protein
VPDAAACVVFSMHTVFLELFSCTAHHLYFSSVDQLTISAVALSLVVLYLQARSWWTRLMTSSRLRHHTRRQHPRQQWRDRWAQLQRVDSAVVIERQLHGTALLCYDVYSIKIPMMWLSCTNLCWLLVCCFPQVTHYTPLPAACLFHVHS